MNRDLQSAVRWRVDRTHSLPVSVLLVTVLATHAAAQPILIDDFNDFVDDGWTQVDSTIGVPWGPGIIDVNGKGEYRFESGGLVPKGTPGGGFLFSTWDESSDPQYSNGFFRGRIRLGNNSTAGLGMRFSGTFETGFNGYLFSAALGTSSDISIVRIINSDGDGEVQLDFPIPVDEDLMLEAGAIGDQLSLKVWLAGEAEPAEPQLEWTESTYSSGLLGVETNIFGRIFHARVDTTFDDIFFTPATAALASSAGRTNIPEPSSLISAMLAAACLGLCSRRRHGNVRCLRSMSRADRTQTVPRALSFGCALASMFALAAPAPAQVMFDLGTFSVDNDPFTGDIARSIPAGTYNHYRLTTNWSSTSGDAWSQEAMWTFADGALEGPATTYYSNPGEAPNSAANNNSVRLRWDDFLDLPISGPLDVSLLPLQTFGGSTARWANTVVEFSFQTPPPSPTLNADLGIVASPFTPLSIVTSGDFDTELAVYSSTGAVIRSNDDAPGAVVHSEIDFDFGLPTGDYVAVLGGFNTTFGDNYVITTGTATGDYGLNVASNPVGGTLAAEQLAYVGFSVGKPTGDFDDSGTVGNKDLTLLLDGWGGAPGAGWTNNPPATVGNDSLTLLLDDWGQSLQLGAVGVPEPSCLTIALLATMSGLAVRRRSWRCRL